MAHTWTIDPFRVRGGTSLKDANGSTISTDSALNYSLTITVGDTTYTRDTIAKAAGQMYSAGKPWAWSVYNATSSTKAGLVGEPAPVPAPAPAPAPVPAPVPVPEENESYTWLVDQQRVRGGSALCNAITGTVLSTSSALDSSTSIVVDGSTYTRGNVINSGSTFSSGKKWEWVLYAAVRG